MLLRLSFWLSGFYQKVDNFLMAPRLINYVQCGSSIQALNNNFNRNSFHHCFQESDQNQFSFKDSNQKRRTRERKICTSEFFSSFREMIFWSKAVFKPQRNSFRVLQLVTKEGAPTSGRATLSQKDKSPSLVNTRPLIGNLFQNVGYPIKRTSH